MSNEETVRRLTKLRDLLIPAREEANSFLEDLGLEPEARFGVTYARAWDVGLDIDRAIKDLSNEILALS